MIAFGRQNSAALPHLSFQTPIRCPFHLSFFWLFDPPSSLLPFSQMAFADFESEWGKRKRVRKYERGKKWGIMTGKSGLHAMVRRINVQFGTRFEHSQTYWDLCLIWLMWRGHKGRCVCVFVSEMNHFPKNVSATLSSKLVKWSNVLDRNSKQP